MSGRYAGKQVVITGHTRGLGKLLAAYFTSEGATVTGLSRSTGCDVGDLNAVRAAMPRKVDILVNSAAVMQANYAFLLSPAFTESMVRTNFIGAYYVALEAAKRDASRIVNIGSIAVPLEDPGSAMYAASKAAVLTMSGVLAKEFSHLGVTLNTIGVSALDTEMFRQHSEATQQAILAKLTPPRLATLADVTHVLDFFCSDAASNVTGQCVYLGGIR